MIILRLSADSAVSAVKLNQGLSDAETPTGFLFIFSGIALVRRLNLLLGFALQEASDKEGNAYGEENCKWQQPPFMDVVTANQRSKKHIKKGQRYNKQSYADG